jgi:hypothetical protein
MEEISQNHNVAVSRLEDVEDDMQLTKNNVDVVKIQLLSAEREIRQWTRSTNSLRTLVTGLMVLWGLFVVRGPTCYGILGRSGQSLSHSERKP